MKKGAEGRCGRGCVRATPVSAGAKRRRHTATRSDACCYEQSYERPGVKTGSFKTSELFVGAQRVCNDPKHDSCCILSTDASTSIAGTTPSSVSEDAVSGVSSLLSCPWARLSPVRSGPRVTTSSPVTGTEDTPLAPAPKLDEKGECECGSRPRWGSLDDPPTQCAATRAPGGSATIGEGTTSGMDAGLIGNAAEGGGATTSGG